MADPTAPTPTPAPTPAPETTAMPAAKPTLFVLGPSYNNHIEPEPAAVPTTTATPGKRTIAFHPTTPTAPGGKVNLKLEPPLNVGDVLPINVYAFFVQPVSSIPASSVLSADWFFKSGSPSGSIHIGAADPATGEFTIPVAGVKPSLDPYWVQTVLEFTGP